MPLPPHPRLLFSQEGITQLKERIERYDWARARWEAVRRSADALLGQPVELPPRGGNWWHWYACPEHGAPLRTGQKIGEWEWEHLCPVDNQALRSDPHDPSRDYDGCVLMGEHGRWAQAVRDLGIACQVTGDDRYARQAAEILLAYARRYGDYPLHTIRGEAKLGGGRVGPQTLDEAVWLIPICQGADLVWDRLSAEERQTIAQGLLQRAAREVILPHRLGVHNIQCWKNSAVGLVGLLLGDEELVREAIDNLDRGYRRQLQEGVQPEGAWWEGAWGYHFYTLSALWPLAEAARNSGTDLYGERLKAMFDAPLAFAMPTLRLPAFNDSGEVNLAASYALYELAYARYRNPAYLRLLSGRDRRHDYALWFGVGELPAAPAARWSSANYPGSGYAILARGEGEQATWLCLKYGPHGGGHGHPDKLNFVLANGGQVVAVDPGTARYGLPAQSGWYRTTLAHNTLSVDETSQRPAEGRCLAFGSEQGVDYVVAEAGAIYDGVRFVRTVALLDENLLVFIDQIQSDRERLLDLACHLRGTWAEPPQGAPWTPPEKEGYRYLRDGRRLSDSSATHLTLRTGEGRLIAWTLASDVPAEIITATGVGDHLEDRVPMVVLRRRGREAAFAWALALDGRPTTLEWLTVRDDQGDPLPASVVGGVRVTGEGQSWCLIANPDGRAVRVVSPEGPERQITALFSVWEGNRPGR